MANQLLRFGVKSDGERCSATWALATPIREKSDVYLACRRLGGTLKASMHESGQWHIAFTEPAYEDLVRGQIPNLESRFVDTWSRPTELVPGCTLAFRIVVPSWAVTSEIAESDLGRIIWIPNAPESKSTEIDILLTHPESVSTGWPGKRGSGTKLVGSLELVNGEILWVVFREIDTPDLPSIQGRQINFFRDKSESDLLSADSLRALVFGNEPDGSKVIFDLTARVSRINPANSQ